MIRLLDKLNTTFYVHTQFTIMFKTGVSNVIDKGGRFTLMQRNGSM